ncbi:MAG TPA: lipoyl(octanoyl) transferase LipB [Hyphomicrobium sp.]|nr:lipoyl(octanoyl) transferase LipB [Hyphomicrobium sp.]
MTPKPIESSPAAPSTPVAWAASHAPVGYLEAVEAMEARAAAIASGAAPELIWLLEHPPLYTAGTSARPEELIAPGRFPVFESGRGGRYTYHGPGQRICYVMLDVKRRAGDVRAFVRALEDWIIGALADLGVVGEVRPGRVGVWVERPQRNPDAEDKIAAIGLRLKRWVSLHGISLNVAPDLGHYAGIVPCGIAEHGVTSLADLGLPHTFEVVDKVLRRQFERRFGTTFDAAPPSIEGFGDSTARISATLERL